MAASRGRQVLAVTPGASVFARLLAEPWRFGFDAAVRLLMRVRRKAEPHEAARFRTVPNLAYPAADVVSVNDQHPGRPPDVATTVGGLTGPSGVLPRLYTEQVIRQARARSEGLHTFVDMLGQRMLAAFAQAGIKYRPARAAEQARLGGTPDPHRGSLLALVGEAEPTLRRPDHERETILHYAGLFAAWPRSADRLEAMLSEWMGHPVQVRQFQGCWLVLPIDQQSRLPKGRDRGQFNRLGYDAAIGARAWDAHGRVEIRVEDLTLPVFRALMPDHPDAERLAGLVRAYLGSAQDFAINPTLRRDAVPSVTLGKGARLGWDTWLDARPRRRGGDEARFSAATIERIARTRGTHPFAPARAVVPHDPMATRRFA